jgi:cytochrome P450
MPLSTPVMDTNGQEMNNIAVPNGTNIIVSLVNANRDPALWGNDSYEWKPERWLGPPPKSVVDAHMPGIYSHMSAPSPICL